MKNIIIVFLLGCVKIVSGQNCDYDSITLTFELEKDTITSFEPLYYTIRMTNNRDSERDIFPLWEKGRFEPMMEYRLIGDSLWEKLPNSDKICGSLMEYPAEEIRMKAQETIILSTQWLKMAKYSGIPQAREHSAFNNVFLEKKKYEIRVAARGCFLKGSRYYSSPQKLYIRPYDNKEKFAIEWLKEKIEYPALIYGLRERLGYSSYASTRGLWREKKININPILTEFIQKFPESELIIYAKLYLVDWNLIGFKFIPNPLKSSEIEMRGGFPNIKKSRILLEEVKEYLKSNKNKYIEELFPFYEGKVIHAEIKAGIRSRF